VTAHLQPTRHPELDEEQAHLDRAYAVLASARAAAGRLWSLSEAGAGGTHQNRYERDVIDEMVKNRLAQLELGDHALVFGRIDRPSPDDPSEIEGFHIGRLSVVDEDQEAVVVDWRAPVAEPFYRATGRNPMGLARRRHFTVQGRTIVDLEDELFGDGAEAAIGEGRSDGLQGYGTLIAALERSRGGQLGDIVATIQGEQDEIIRAPQSGVLVVQGGPGTGKTVVALHRAAYLLYTHRFPLEDQGVLVLGPNRVFLRYIARVLPSLGEAGIDQFVLTDLVPDVTFGAVERVDVARIKGEARMASVVAKAVRDRQRPLRRDVRVPFGTTYLTLSVAVSEQIVAAAKRRYRRHNAARRYVEQEVFAHLALTAKDETSSERVREVTRGTDEVRALLERMWPVLTPAQLLHDLLGSKPLLRLAGGRHLTEHDVDLLHRERSETAEDVRWTDADAPLLDAAREALGPVPRRGVMDDRDEIRTYGHIVIDEVQDLSPMQLSMAARRSLNGNLTVVGDIAQATGPFAPSSWNDVLRHLPDRRGSRIVNLTVGYRIPAQVMAIANRVLAEAAPTLVPPRPIREGDVPPAAICVGGPSALAHGIVDAVGDLRRNLGDPSIAVIVPTSLVASLEADLASDGLVFGRAVASGLDQRVTLMPVGLVKGLELDAVVVVEPARIVREETQGLRALYVALTRPTKGLTIVHAEPLPDVLGQVHSLS
jgi:DNA helicase IV